MRKLIVLLSMVLLSGLASCVTINVYFPEAAAEQAADQFIGSVLDGKSEATPPADNAKYNRPSPAAKPPPSASVLDFMVAAAYAAGQPRMRIHTLAIDAIHQRLRQRFQSTLKPLFDRGVIGLTQDGLVALCDVSKLPLAQRSTVLAEIAAEDRDRNALYRQIAAANGQPEWEADIRRTFARLWIEKAHSGWCYRDASGTWKRK